MKRRATITRDGTTFKFMMSGKKLLTILDANAGNEGFIHLLVATETKENFGTVYVSLIWVSMNRTLISEVDDESQAF